MCRQSLFLCPLLLLAACSELLEPVESTPEPSEYSYNYWLLQKTYLYGEELSALPEEGDSVQLLYDAVKDKYTRYTEPPKSAKVIESRNTSIITGDIGLEFWFTPNDYFPLSVRHVFPGSPAGRAGVPKGGFLISINGTELSGDDAYSKYKAVFNQNADISQIGRASCRERV